MSRSAVLTLKKVARVGHNRLQQAAGSVGGRDHPDQRIAFEDVIRHHLTVFRDERVQIDQMADPVGDRVGDSGHDHAAIGMAAQYHIIQLLLSKEVDDLFDVGGHVDRRESIPGPFREAGKRGREHPMAPRSQEVGEPPVAPAAMIGAMDQHVGPRIGGQGCRGILLIRARISLA